MARPNLQTVIVTKKVAKTRAAATKVARKYANRIYTSRETKNTWRFRQRPPDEFKKGTFRTFKIPDVEGVSLVYGDLKSVKTKKKGSKAKKRVKNPLEATPENHRDWRKMLETLIPAAGSLDELAGLAFESRLAFGRSGTMVDVVDGAILQKAKKIRPTFRCDRRSVEECVEHLMERYGRAGTAAQLPDRTDEERWQKRERKLEVGEQKTIFDNPQRKALKNPRLMPDPGPLAWLGSLLEWRWVEGGGDVLWEPAGGPWMFLWSPSLKAVVCIQDPQAMHRMSRVSRKGGAAKLFERFTARNAQNTYEISVPKSKMKKLGTAGHIVYRSDKWNPGKDIDYIHDFGKGVRLYCGPSLKNPKVFLCFGGKLTATERGLVF